MMRPIFRRFLLALLGMGSFAQAQGFQEPALYDVSDVVAPDTLNIRAAPDASAEDIGDLAADAKGIEVIMLDESRSWGLIKWGSNEEGSGWVSMRYLQRREHIYIPGQRIHQGMYCEGTEPFWSIEFLSNGTVEFDNFGSGAAFYRLLWSDGAAGRGNGPVGFSAVNGSDSMMGILTSIETYGNLCDDGMSGVPFGIHLDVILPSRDHTYYIKGCCSLKRPEY